MKDNKMVRWKFKWKQKIALILCGVMMMFLSLFESCNAADRDFDGKVELGCFHSAVIKDDGSLWTWGNNEDGQLGDGTTENKSSPEKIMEDVESVSFGDFHGAAVKKDGSLWMWGNNECGQLGDGTTDNKSSPIRVMEDVKMVSLGDFHSAVIKNDGSLWIWGANYYGQLGDGTVEKKNSPIKIMEDVKLVDLDDSYSAVVKNDGSLWTWGDNIYGKLGSKTTARWDFSPVKILEDVEMISLGYGHGAAIKNDGSLWIWGYNKYGQLGDGTTEDNSSPVKILEDVKLVSMGGYHSAAIKSDGSLWMWGYNKYGQLGDGTTEDNSSPERIMEDVEFVSLRGYHSAVIKSDGSLWIWGNNECGQLGDGTTDNKSSPFKLMELATDLDEYIVNYNANGGSGAPVPQSKYYGVTLILNFTIPTRTGYTFLGWATSSTATSAIYQPGDSYTENSDVTLYAVWEKEPVIENQTIIASSKTVVYKSKAFYLGARASGNGKLSYSSSNKEVATISNEGKVTVKGYGRTIITIKASAIGKYLAASKKITIQVVPKKMTLGKIISPKKKTMEASWKADKTTSGYQMYISTKKDFTQNTYKRTYKVSKSKMSLIGLKSKKTYYVKIRAYKKVGTQTYYGSWSSAKKVKIK